MNSNTYKLILKQLDKLFPNHKRVGMRLPQVGHVMHLRKYLIHHLIHEIDRVLNNVN